MAISVLDPGFATTVQDLGRYGCAHLGISPSGAADSLSFRIANLMVGNHENAPAVEMTLSGVTLQFDEPALVAIAGAECAFEMHGKQIAHGQVIEIGSGTVVKCGRISHGVRTYLAVQGGFNIPLVLRSASTNMVARFGGLHGRILRKGDRLFIGTSPAKKTRVLNVEKMYSRKAAGEIVLRVTRGVQQEWFAADDLNAFFSEPFKVSEQCGRTGIRIVGERIVARHTSQLLTDGIPLGAVQVPPEGLPIILFVDQQTTGGYPKIANVIAADMHSVGQLRPQDVVRFQEVSMDEAVHLLREQENWLKNLFESGE